MPSITIRMADLGWPIISPIISWWSEHWANHCDLLTSPSDMITAAPGGVVEHGVPDCVARRVEYLSIACTQEQRDRAIAFARSQIGKPYDYAGVFWFPFRPRWNDQRRWFCSELTAAALEHAGLITVPKFAHRVSPGDLHRIITSRAKT